jgi:uncharacterized protein (UPF0276 family)
LLENVSTYFEFTDSEIPESDFVAELVRSTGCGILLDVNNLCVNEHNHGRAALEFINGIPIDSVGEIHLAGHRIQEYEGYEIAVDTHDAPVSSTVWDLYFAAVRRFGRVPTLIEWDSELPTLDVLIGEARTAQRIMETCDAIAA